MTRTLPRLIADDGTEIKLDVERWLEPADDIEASVLARVVGPALDVGCGPGRIALALSEMGIPCLGVDVSPSAIQTALRRGALVVERSIFGRVPGHGRWQTVLLFDGNIGIGGDPIHLMERVSSLLHPHGRIITELEPEGSTRYLRVRLDADSVLGPEFSWALVGPDDFKELCLAAGCRVEEIWTAGGRTFASLARRLAA